MKIINFRSFDEILPLLKDTPLLTDSTKKPYKNARIKLLEVNPEDLNLSTLYYIKDKIPFQENLRNELLKDGYDTLNLGGVLTFEGDDGKEYSIMPPVVEVLNRKCNILSREGEIDYKDKVFNIKFPVLLDGFHRAFLAKKLGVPLQVFYIENIQENCPSYAHPNTWNEVVACDEVPTEMSKKKYYIAENPKPFYKDFSGLVFSHFRETK